MIYINFVYRKKERIDKLFEKVSRRQFLVWGAGASLLNLCSGSVVHAGMKLLKPRQKRNLWLYNTHTGEYFKDLYWEKGKYSPSSLKKINTLLRDHRENKVKSIDTELLDLLFNIQCLLNYNKPFDVISGYRSVKTNARLRRASKGVALNSYHTKGKAIDIMFRGLSLKRAHKAVCSLKVGGVGYYPKSGFIHVDVRGWPAIW